MSQVKTRRAFSRKKKKVIEHARNRRKILLEFRAQSTFHIKFMSAPDTVQQTQISKLLHTAFTFPFRLCLLLLLFSQTWYCTRQLP